MAEIHPNDIGLATFADVGDVEKLKTSAKNLVDALNEIYQNGTQGGGSAFGEQWYVDGENNIILGENNIVCGNNNFIIGSDNIVVGDNITMIASKKYKYGSVNIGYENFDTETGIIPYYIYSDEQTDTTLKVGDKLVFSLGLTWVDSGWNDWLTIESPKKIVEILEVNTDEKYIRITTDIGISTEPPDETHTVKDYQYISTFIPLIDAYKLIAGESSISFGGTSGGASSFSGCSGSAGGAYSFAANSANAKGRNAAALCSSTAEGEYSFSAGSSCAYGEKTAALNSSYAYAPYSFSAGNYSRVYARALKCTNLNWKDKTLTIDPKYSLAGIKSGDTIVLRCFNCINTIIFSQVKVKSISGNTIYMPDDTYAGGAGSYIQQLFPDGIIFVQSSNSSYATSSAAGGCYGMATGKYSFADGYHVISAADNAVTFGKYGINTDACSIALANGTAIKTPGLAFKVLSDGSVHADKEYTSPCADYAEYFEWADGNPNNEDRAGYFVKLKDDKIVLCEDFDIPLGIISATPAIIGDSGEMHWQGKFLTDEFGRIQYHDVTVPAETDEDGNTITEEHIETQPILNPDWNPEQEYIPRKDRPEWSAIGVLGKLIVYDDGTLQSGDICRCGDDGKAVKSIESGYTVLKRVSDDKILIWFKG